MPTVRQIRSVIGTNLLLKWYPRLLGYRLQRAISEKDFEVAYSIRHAVYTECGYLDADDHQANRFHDAYDEHSVTFLAFYRNTPAGTIRLTNTRNGSPVFEHFNVLNASELMGPSCCEIGRFAVLEKYRRPNRLVAMGLIGMCYYYSLQNNIERWIGYGPHYILDSFLLFTRPKTLPLGELTEAHRQARQSLAGYFQKHGDNLVVFSVNAARTQPWHALGHHLKSLFWGPGK